ncbi:MAG: bifunctional oligoribonuclease/PAP phosphatase NrnA [Erysipelotrichia bacterium]|nr:bifunctional oligoribonuclease/PAP phosphatase NrnA [Erysipelotrichia bacterium]
MKLKDVKELIEQYDSIVIYRHIHPDYDAFGSQLGMKYLLQENYPQKKIYTYGKEMIDNPDFLEPMDNPNLNIIRNSLTISLDTSTSNRSDDDSYKEGKCSLKIDHHLKSEHCTTYEYVKPHACSASYLVAKLAINSKWKISAKAAGYLYAGICSDTVGLTVDSVDKDTFLVIAKLMSSNFDLARVNRYIRDETVDKFKAGNYFGSKAIFVEDVAYIVATMEEREKLHVSLSEAKDYVDQLSKIRGVNKYAVFSQDDKDKYSVSLRSHGPSIVEIARKYGGGGHKLASGIPSVSEKQIKEIIQMLINKKD